MKSLGETLASLRARTEAGRAPAALAPLLHRIADDEEWHAELGFRTIAWLLDVGGADVRGALEDEVARLQRELCGRPVSGRLRGRAAMRDGAPRGDARRGVAPFRRACVRA